jgi:hypothetical protein
MQILDLRNSASSQATNTRAVTYLFLTRFLLVALLDMALDPLQCFQFQVVSGIMMHIIMTTILVDVQIECLHRPGLARVIICSSLS